MQGSGSAEELWDAQGPGEPNMMEKHLQQQTRARNAFVQLLGDFSKGDAHNRVCAARHPVP